MPKPELETRVVTVGKLEIRTAADKPAVMIGHAALFNSLSEDMGFFEEIAPGCFSRAIKEKQDVRSLFNHDANFVLGRTKSGTLRLSEDEQGLAIENDLPDTTFSRDLQMSMARGDIDQMSFSFRCMTDEWSRKDGKDIRRLIDVDLYDISPVTFPAYADTEVGLRSLERFKKTVQLDPDTMRRARLFLAKHNSGR